MHYIALLLVLGCLGCGDDSLGTDFDAGPIDATPFDPSSWNGDWGIVWECAGFDCSLGRTCACPDTCGTLTVAQADVVQFIDLGDAETPLEGQALFWRLNAFSEPPGQFYSGTGLLANEQGGMRINGGYEGDAYSGVTVESASLVVTEDGWFGTFRLKNQQACGLITSSWMIRGFWHPYQPISQ